LIIVIIIIIIIIIIIMQHARRHVSVIRMTNRRRSHERKNRFWTSLVGMSYLIAF